MHLRIIFSICILVVLCTSACAPNRADTSNFLPQAKKVDPPRGSEMLYENTYAGDALATILVKRMLSDKTILVSSFVDLENINSTSPFGKTTMQQVSSRLSQNGFQVIEARLGDSLRISPQAGELFLTQDVSRLLQTEHKAHAVLVGVYSSSGDRIFVSSRVIRLQDGVILAAYEYYIPFTGDARNLLYSVGGNGAFNKLIWDHYAPRQHVTYSPTSLAGTETKLNQ